MYNYLASKTREWIMHFFNIMSARWGGRKSNLVSIRSIILTPEAQIENEYSRKNRKVTISFLTSPIIHCPPKNCHFSCYKNPSPPYPFSFLTLSQVSWCVGGGGGGYSEMCVTLLVSPGRRVRRRMKTKKNVDYLSPWNSFRENTEGEPQWETENWNYRHK